MFDDNICWFGSVMQVCFLSVLETNERSFGMHSSFSSLGSVITNGIGANALLLGNQINPASAVAQKMAETLNSELEAHSIYREEEKAIPTGLVGPALPGKRDSSTPSGILNSSQPPPLPQSLEQLLERQWEQGSQFLMEQAQHFDSKFKKIER